MVYLITNLVNGKFYIGCTKKDKERMNNGEGYRGDNSFYSDIRRYGWTSFSKETIYVTHSIEDAAFVEHFFIQLAKRTSRQQCYNANTWTLYGQVPTSSYNESRVLQILSESEPTSSIRRFYSELTQETEGAEAHFDEADPLDFWDWLDS